MKSAFHTPSYIIGAPLRLAHLAPAESGLPHSTLNNQISFCLSIPGEQMIAIFMILIVVDEDNLTFAHEMLLLFLHQFQIHLLQFLILFPVMLHHKNVRELL